MSRSIVECVLARIVILAIVFPCGASVAEAQKPWNQRQRPDRIENDYARSGFPWELRRHARPTYTPFYDYGYVGGGASLGRGEPRSLEEGTWGRDYVGIVYPRSVWLNWWHGRRYQGGTGAYSTDGPRLRRE